MPNTRVIVDAPAPTGRGPDELFLTELPAAAIPAAAVAGVVADSAQIATNVTNIATNVTDIALLQLGLSRARRQLSASEILALLGTNIEIIPAPAAGLAVLPVAWFIFHAHGGTDFVQPAVTDALALKYNGGIEICEMGSEAQMEALIEAAGDAALSVEIASMFAAVGIVPVAATAVDIDNNGVSEYTTGNGTFSVEVWFRTLTMAAFPSDP